MSAICRILYLIKSSQLERARPSSIYLPLLRGLARPRSATSKNKCISRDHGCIKERQL